MWSLLQRTELFEYAKFLGNSQYVLLQLQAYKLIYAHMLAEVGKVSDSLKYVRVFCSLLESLSLGVALRYWINTDTVKLLTNLSRLGDHQRWIH